jgi:hypothetical protein
VDPHLHRLFVGSASEFPQQVADLVLAAIDQMAIGRIVDRIGHLGHDLFKIGPH